MSTEPIMLGAVPLWAPDSAEVAGLERDTVPRLIPYLPAATVPTGAVIVCPGGGYQRHAPHEGEPVARWLVGLGLAAFVLTYRVAPHRHPAPLQDVRRAIRLVRERAAAWQVRPDRVCVLGFSAGGHVAASVGTIVDDQTPPEVGADISSRPDALILCYPVISFGAHRHDGSLRSLLGANPPDDLRAALSLETRVGAHTPPTFLWHTADDASVPVENSLLFAAALRRHDIPFALHVFPHGRHGLGLATDDPTVGMWTTLCARWLVEGDFVSPRGETTRTGASPSARAPGDARMPVGGYGP